MENTARSRSTVRGVLYPNASWYFALAIVVTWVGFSMSYFARLGETTLITHVHGASAGLWMGLLVVQPILYRRGQWKLHRRLGWTGTIVLVPILMIGGLAMMHSMMRGAVAAPPGTADIAYVLVYLDTISLIMFPLFLGLSLRHGRQAQLHARYMACTVLVLLPPAITRMLFFIPWFNSLPRNLNGSFFAIEGVLLLLLLDDKRMGRIQAPYVVALVLFAIVHLTMFAVGTSAGWHTLMNRFAAL